MHGFDFVASLEYTDEMKHSSFKTRLIAGVALVLFLGMAVWTVGGWVLIMSTYGQTIQARGLSGQIFPGFTAMEASLTVFFGLGSLIGGIYSARVLTRGSFRA